MKSVDRRSWLLYAATWLAAIALLVALQAALLPRAMRLPLQDRPLTAALTSGLHEREDDARGVYRWTAGEARIELARPGSGSAELHLALGPGAPGGPAELQLGLGATPVPLALDGMPRSYRLLVPQVAGGSLPVRLTSDTTTLLPDKRALGVRLEGLGLRRLGQGPAWPAPGLVLLQAGILALLGLVGALLRAPAVARVALLLGGAALLALVGLRYPLVAPVYLARLAAALAVLAALTLLALPALERGWGPWLARPLWALTLLACMLRLAGALFPPFAAYDLGLNLGRLSATVGGTLVATNESFEFGGGLTVYPSGPYVVLMPGMLAGLTPKLAVQGGIALLDGLATLGVAALGLALGWPRRALLFACLAYAALPIGLTTLYYGHTAQAFGQALMAPLAAVLLAGLRGHPGPWPWLVAGALFAAALLSHIGVTILALAWLGLAWLALTLWRRLDARTWRSLSLTLLAGGMVGLIFVYGPVALRHVAILAALDFGGEGVAPAPAYNLIAKAWWIAFTPLGLLLAATGLPLLRELRLPRGATELLGAWLGAVGLFWGVEMLTGLQVRYLVFLAPLACLLAGLSLAWLAERGRAGPWLAWATGLAVAAQGAWVWLPGAFEYIAPSMVPLLR